MRFLKLVGSRLPHNLLIEIVLAIHAGPKSKLEKSLPHYSESIHLKKVLRFYKLLRIGVKLDKKSEALAEEWKSLGGDI